MIIFAIYYKNKFYYSSIFNDFCGVSFTTIVIAMYLIFDRVSSDDYDSSVCNN